MLLAALLNVNLKIKEGVMNKEKLLKEVSYYIMAPAPICAVVAIFFAKVGTEHIMRGLMLSAVILLIIGELLYFYHFPRKHTHL